MILATPERRTARIVSLALAMLVVASATPDEGLASVRRAVLIGINEYQADQFMDLRGAVNDVTIFENWFEGVPGSGRELALDAVHLPR